MKKSKVADVTYFIPYASGFGKKKDFVNQEAKERCDLALKLARKNNKAIFLLGAGLSERGYTRYGRASLADEMAKYLESQGWPRKKIYTNPIGYETVGETAAALEMVKLLGGKEIVAVTSWYHVPRVWVIWRLGFGKKVTVKPSGNVSIPALLKELPKIPFSLAVAHAIRHRV